MYEQPMSRIQKARQLATVPHLPATGSAHTWTGSTCCLKSARFGCSDRSSTFEPALRIDATGGSAAFAANTFTAIFVKK